MFWNEEGGGWKEGGCLAFAYRDDTSVQKGRNSERKKKKGKKKKKSTPSNLFLFGISGLYNQQLQADPTFTSPVTQNHPPSSIRRTERGNRPTSNTTNRAAIVELLLLGAGAQHSTQSIV